MPASERARRAIWAKKERWWRAVSFGRKPVPGGETKVCRMLERTEDWPVMGSCEIMPMPSLLALPSQPRAMRGLGILGLVGWLAGWLYSNCLLSWVSSKLL